MKVEKPHNSGQWTKARMRSFIMSALRRAQWPVKYEAIRQAFVEKGINPATGKQCKLHKCSDCGNMFPAKDMRADHIKPIVPVEGFDNWDGVISRLFCELDGFQALCNDCHKVKTNAENEERKKNKNKSCK